MKNLLNTLSADPNIKEIAQHVEWGEVKFMIQDGKVKLAEIKVTVKN